jgi:uncharacterized protein YndB with AHSA1/START domain
MTTPVGSDPEVLTAGSASHSIDISRSVRAPIGRVWQTLVSREGAAAWLGEGAELGAKGEPYHCADGAVGVVRSYHPLEQLRVSWHSTPDSPASIIELDLRADGDDTILDLHHERIGDTAERERLEVRWRAGLEALAQRVTST